MNNIVKFYRLTIELSDSYHALNKTITDDFSSMEDMKKFCDEYGFIIGGEQGSGYKNGKGDWYVDESDDLLYIGGERRPSNTTHYGCSYCDYETLYREE